MAWSRIESAFWRHPKFAGWKASEKWALGELIGYCCEYRTEGVIPDDLALLPRSITVRFIELATDSGWIDVDEDGTRRIHDWHIYHPKDPTAADRIRRHRASNGRPSTNQWQRTRELVFARDQGICADCGRDCKEAGDDASGRWNADHEPPRKILEARGDSIYDIGFIVTRCHSCHSKKTRKQALQERTNTEPNTEPATEPNRIGSVSTNTNTNTTSKDQPTTSTEDGLVGVENRFGNLEPIVIPEAVG